jgi:hypothetical protein
MCPRLRPSMSQLLANASAPMSALLSLRPYLLTQSLHQPCALIGPSTSVQEDGGTNSLQFAQLWPPFGEFR